MFCPKCANQLPDDAVVCSACGYQIRQNVPGQSAQPQPAYNPNLPKVTEFDKKAKKLIPITFLLTLVLLAVSIMLPLTTDIFEIPFVNTAMEITGMSEDIDDAKDELAAELDTLADELKEMEDTYEEHEDEMSSDEKKLMKKALKSADKILDDAENVAEETSLINFRSFIGGFREISEDLEDLDVFDGMDEATETFEQIEGIVNLIIIVVMSLFALPLIFTLLGGLLRSKGLTITALVFMVLSQLILCGVLWVVLSLVIYILQAILCGKAKKVKRYAQIA